MHVGMKLIYTGENDSPYFTNGSEYEVIGDNGSMWYVTDNDGTASNAGYGHLWPKDDIADSFRPLPVGPVVTETVTKTRIVPGVYDGVEVGETIVIPDCENPDREIHPSLEVSLVGVYQADELDAAAAVLSALAKGLRDA